MFIAIFRGGKQVLIEIVVGSKIAQVPVECRPIRPHADGDAWHHDVPAISGVTRNRKGPCVRRSRCRGGLLRRCLVTCASEMNQERTEKHNDYKLESSRFQDYPAPFCILKTLNIQDDSLNCRCGSIKRVRNTERGFINESCHCFETHCSGTFVSLLHPGILIFC